MRKPNRHDDALEFKIARLELKEGDTLVAAVDPTSATLRTDLLRQNLEMVAPKGVAILIVSADVRLSVITGGSK